MVTLLIMTLLIALTTRDITYNDTNNNINKCKITCKLFIYCYKQSHLKSKSVISIVLISIVVYNDITYDDFTYNDDIYNTYYR
jgi:hypothetical protein